MARGGSTIGTFVAIGGVVLLSFLAIRTMTKRQRAAHPATSAPPSASTIASGTRMIEPIPPAIVADAGKAGVARLDVVMRVDGLDLTYEGAPACRADNRRLVGRAPGGGVGSFDEDALVTCITKMRVKSGDKRMVAMIGRAGPAVPTTYQDALVAALKRAGIADVVVTP